MNPVSPCVAKGLHLLRLASDVIDIPILHITAGRRPLKVRVELDPVRRVDINALNLTSQPLPLRQGCHQLADCRRESSDWSSWRRADRTRSWHPLGHAVEVGKQVE